MMIKFLKHGIGSATHAAQYVLSDTDHLGALREGVKTLRGNAAIFTAIADSCGFKQRYTSGVIAFAPEDEPSEKDIEDVLDSFEELAFAGLEKEDYHLFAVQHDEPDGSKHVHILIPRVHLGTKKSLNIAPPNHSSVFYPWRDWWNEKKSWASPKDPRRRRRIGKTKDGFLLDKQKVKMGLELEKDEREFIVDAIEKAIRAGKVKDRSGVEHFLKNEFLTEDIGIVSRVVRNSISVRLYKNEVLGKPMRLTGAFFDADFNADQWLALQAEKEQLGEPSQRPKKTPDLAIVAELATRVTEIKQRRAERQRTYYAYEKLAVHDDEFSLPNLIKLRPSHDISDPKSDTSTAAVAERLDQVLNEIAFIETSGDALYSEIDDVEKRVEGFRASISDMEKQTDHLKQAADKKEQRASELRAGIQANRARIEDVRKRLVIVNDSINRLYEQHKDELRALFFDVLDEMPTVYMKAIQQDLVLFMHYVLIKKNKMIDQEVGSLLKLFVNAQETELMAALSKRRDQYVDQLTPGQVQEYDGEAAFLATDGSAIEQLIDEIGEVSNSAENPRPSNL